MMQQLSFSPVENILTVLFAAAILGYLLYLLVRSLRNRQRGYHTVNRAKVYSKAQATAVNQPVYLANGTVNSGVTEAENVKTVIFENLEKEGEQITLEVSDRIYSELQEGDCGSLSCRDGRYRTGMTESGASADREAENIGGTLWWKASIVCLTVYGVSVWWEAIVFCW